MDFQNQNLEQKLNAQKQADAVSSTAAVQAGIASGNKGPSVAREHENAINFHKDQLHKNFQASSFFRENPAFAEFVDLIRRGIIQV